MLHRNHRNYQHKKHNCELLKKWIPQQPCYNSYIWNGSTRPALILNNNGKRKASIEVVLIVNQNLIDCDDDELVDESTC